MIAARSSHTIAPAIVFNAHPAPSKGTTMKAQSCECNDGDDTACFREDRACSDGIVASSGASPSVVLRRMAATDVFS
jgi:hypothetical protein